MKQHIQPVQMLPVASFVMLILLIVFSTTSCHKTLGAMGNDSTTITLQPGLYSGFNESIYCVIPYNENPESTYVSPVPSENFNGDSILTVNNSEFEGGFAANILLRFDSVFTIPPTDSIISATLYMYGVDSLATTANAVGAYSGNTLKQDSVNGMADFVSLQKITSDWDGNTVAWNTRPSGTDTGSIAIPASATRWNNNISVDVTELAKFWVSNPSKNFGCRLVYVSALSAQLPQPFPGGFEQMQFYSTFAANPAVRPKLVITYKK